MLSRRLMVLVTIAAVANAQFEIPEIHIQAISPVGIRAAIEAVPGIRVFGFHARIHDGIGDKETGAVNGDVTVVKDGRFIVEDLNARAGIGDVLNYWVFVQYENMGYRKDGQSFKVEGLSALNTPFPPLNKAKVPNKKQPTNCERGKTIVKGQQACKGHLIFEENFLKSPISIEKWQIEKKLSNDDQENSFNSYQPSSVRIEGTTLKITPTLQYNMPGYDRNNIIDGELDLLTGCTSRLQRFCKEEGNSFNILSPVVSGRITTRDLFSFKYGKIEIKAKLPQGDWIYPELLLEPATSVYGMTGYESGLIRVAFSRGNSNLKLGEEDLGNNVLYGGLLMEQIEPCRSKAIVKNPDISKPWGNDFHTYGMTWTEDSITFEVDKIKYGTITPPPNGFKSFRSDEKCISIANVFKQWESGRNIAPFDQEFYITLGLGVGGISDFPGTPNKPWKNSSPKARSKFWSNESTWYPTWGDNKSLVVDSVKVWAL